jgi:hypothetical protein
MKLQKTVRKFAALAAHRNREPGGYKLKLSDGGMPALVAISSMGAGLLCAPLPALGQTYDLAADWSISTNPNGVWTYGQMNGALAFTPFTETVDAAYLGDFFGPQPAWDGGYPMVLGQSTGNTLLDFPTGRVGGHISNDTNTYMAVKWTAPAAGSLDITGGLWMFRNIGREALVSLYVNGVEVCDDVLIPSTTSGCNSSATFSLAAAVAADGGSASELLGIPIAAGDVVILAVRKTGGSPYGDYVGTDLSLVVTNSGTPIATDDYYGMNQGTSLTMPSPGVLANDSDPNEDPLTAELVTGPANAYAFQLNANGSFSYTPSMIFHGEDSFTYRAFDGSEYSEIVTVRITVSQPGAQGFITGGGKYFQEGRKCTFGFAAKVEGTGVQGNLEFKDHDAGVRAESQSVDWVYAPNQADGFFSGTCTLNGMTGYTFLVQVKDLGQPGSNDRFAIWIYDEFNTLVYSSGAALSGGNIVNHRN